MNKRNQFLINELNEKRKSYLKEIKSCSCLFTDLTVKAYRNGKEKYIFIASVFLLFIILILAEFFCFEDPLRIGLPITVVLIYYAASLALYCFCIAINIYLYNKKPKRERKNYTTPVALSGVIKVILAPIITVIFIVKKLGLSLMAEYLEGYLLSF